MNGKALTKIGGAIAIAAVVAAVAHAAGGAGGAGGELGPPGTPGDAAAARSERVAGVDLSMDGLAHITVRMGVRGGWVFVMPGHLPPPRFDGFDASPRTVEVDTIEIRDGYLVIEYDAETTSINLDQVRIAEFSGNGLSLRVGG